MSRQGIHCCIPDYGCRIMSDIEECIAAGGEDNGVDCDDPNSLCEEFDRDIPPTGCYDGPPTFEDDPTKNEHTLDICEHTTAVPTFIDPDNPDEVPRFEPVSTHLSRAQPVGAGQDPCAVNEGFLVLDNHGDAEHLMCTGRAITQVGYAHGQLFMVVKAELENGTEDERLQLIQELENGTRAESVEILYATESPFPLEVNLFSDGKVCPGIPI